MAVLIGTSNGYYFKESFGGGGWQTITTTIQPDYQGQWAPLGNCACIFTQRGHRHPVFFIRGTISGTSYTPDPDTSYDCRLLDTGFSSDFGSAIHCACEHGGRALISKHATIRYSNPLDYLTGYDANYVNVGPSDDHITGLYNLNGNLYVLKQGSVWGMGGDYGELTSQVFRKIISGCGSSYHVNCLADGKIFFGNPAGLYLAGGREAVYLSKPIENYWQSCFNEDEAFIAYWNYKKWLLVRLSSTSNLLIYDLPSQRWFPVDHFNASAATGSPIMEKWFLMGSEGNHTLQNLNFTSAGSDTVIQELRTPFTGLGSPYDTKYLSRVFIHGTGMTGIEIYTRSIPGHSGNLVFSMENPGTEVICPQVSFKELSIKLIGAGGLITGGIAVECQARRI